VSQQQIQPPRGMNDILPDEDPSWERLDTAARALFGAYGYRRIRIPVLERTELFSRSLGELTDIVAKEMYTFEDRNGESVTLRPEATAGVVRASLTHGLLHNQQQKLWCSGPMFRREKPQKGRYRQFHQLNVEALGYADPEVDAELIVMSARLWRELGIESVRLELDSLGAPAPRPRGAPGRPAPPGGAPAPPGGPGGRGAGGGYSGGGWLPGGGPQYFKLGVLPFRPPGDSLIHGNRPQRVGCDLLKGREPCLGQSGRSVLQHPINRVVSSSGCLAHEEHEEWKLLVRRSRLAMFLGESAAAVIFKIRTRLACQRVLSLA
jgi:hypothetical protein